MSDNTPPAETVSKAEFEKVQSQMQNWMAKATDYEKKFGGIDIEALRAKAEERDILLKQGAGGDPAKIDAIVSEKEKEITSRFSNKIEELTSKVSKQESDLKALRVTNVVMTKAADVFHASAIDLIQSIVEKECDFQDGSIIIKDSQGKPRFSEKDPRKLMDVSEYLETLASKYTACAKPVGTGGGKSSGEKSSGGVVVGEYSSLADLARKHPNPAEQKKILNEMAAKDPNSVKKLLSAR